MGIYNQNSLWYLTPFDRNLMFICGILLFMIVFFAFANCLENNRRNKGKK